MLILRNASPQDAPAIAALATHHEQTFDPAATPMTVEGARSFIEGYADPCLARVSESAGQIVVALNLHPDEVRRTLYLDVYCAPNTNFLNDAVSAAMAWADEDFRGWTVRPGVNRFDHPLRAELEAHQFSPLRIFWTMRRPLGDYPRPGAPDGLSLERLNLDDEASLREWHRAHEDAFAHHFDFTTRSFEQFVRLVAKDPTIDPDGVLVVRADSRIVAYASCSLELRDVNSGYIDKLGVISDFRGRGLGELALRAGMSRCAELRFNSVALDVDSENESGALRLYEKLGFTVASAWIQYDRSNKDDCSATSLE